jgi:uncharacterized protein YdhG (YjbR/CyaY superfamily)
MSASQTKPRTIDEYIAGFPPDIQKVLRKIRSTIRAAAPQAEETLKYQMPTYTLNGNLVYFAVHKKHIGVYPVPAGTEKFQKEIAPYRGATSTARFPLNEPLPFDLISRLVKFRVRENLARAKAKAKLRQTLKTEGLSFRKK